MSSIKQVLSCIGLSGNISLIRDFFGLPVDPSSKLSLLEQVQRLKDKYINLNMFEMGPNLYKKDTFGNDQYVDIANAICGMRSIYAREANLGIGRIKHIPVLSTDAPNRMVMDNDAETTTLANEYPFDTDAINVFFVLLYVSERGFIGVSDIGGTCNNPIPGARNGLIVSLQAPGSTYYILAHEVGHYLGLCHADDPKCPTTNDNPKNLMISNTVRDPASLTQEQADKMRSHCFVKEGCR